MKVLTTEIEIAAAPERVWEILMDFASYPEWNPFITGISGERKVGSKLEAKLRPAGAKARTFHPTVTAVEESARFEWLGKLGFSGVFDGRHQFTIEATPGGTKFIQSEEFTGLLVPLLSRSLDKGTRAGFEAMNQALQLRAEAVGNR